jgi:sugar phosphate isomerase/epimerase
VKRRGFLSLAASSYLLGAERKPEFQFPTRPIDRLSVSSYPFRAYIDVPGNRERDLKLPGMDLVGFGKRVKQEWQVHHIEPWSPHFRSTDDAFLAGLKSDLQRAGIGIANVAADVPGSLYDPDEAVRQKAIEARKTWIDIAAKVGSPGVRVNNPPAGKSPPDTARMVDSMKKLGAYAESRGVVVNFENDNLVSENALFLARAVRDTGTPWVRALPDFCNSMLAGNERFEYEALSALFPLAWSICHVKEFENGPTGKLVSIDVGRAFTILKDSGFRGFCSMEFDSEGDPFQGTGELIRKSLQYLS